MNNQTQEIIKKQLNKKIKRLADLEKKQFTYVHNEEYHEFKISRSIYACVGGFIILRTFSKEKFTPFTLLTFADRVEIILKKFMPIEAEDGVIFNLYELLKNTIGLTLGIGSKLDLGSRGGGITVGENIKIDGFQIMICRNDQIEEIADTLEDISFVMLANNEIEDLEIENKNLKQNVEVLSEISDPIIITEGKTDWKYIIKALRFFHARNEFLNIKEDWFLKFGSERDMKNDYCGTNFNLENSVSKLNSIMDSFLDSRKIDNKQNKYVRIGIYDSDDKQAKIKEDYSNKVFAFLIEPKDISTEFLFSDDEIKTTLAGKRLYFGKEFDVKTGQLISDRVISIGNDNNARNKAGKRVIIDSNIFNSKGENIALSKDEFSNKIFNDEIQISIESWLNFKHIFEKISKYIN